MRIRTIKPEFFMHDRLFDLEDSTGLPVRLGFIGIWCVADREGRFKWEPRRIGAQVLPYDNVDFSRVLDALASRGFIVKYESAGRLYGYIPSFKSHQHINARETNSVLPAPPEVHKDQQHATRELHVIDASSTCHDLARGEGKGREGKGKEGEICQSIDTSISVDADASTQSALKFSEVIDAWNEQGVFPKADKVTSSRQRSLKARLADPYFVENWREALARARGSPFCRGDNERGWRANIDWFLRPDTVPKLMEGQYSDAKNARRSSLEYKDEGIL